MLSDRRALLDGLGLPLDDGLALEARLGREVLDAALRGAGASPAVRAAAPRTGV